MFGLAGIFLGAALGRSLPVCLAVALEVDEPEEDAVEEEGVADTVVAASASCGEKIGDPGSSSDTSPGVPGRTMRETAG